MNGGDHSAAEFTVWPRVPATTDKWDQDRELGLAQLARNLVALGAETMVLDPPIELPETVFPVLLVLDDLLDGPGHQELLASDFQALLGDTQLGPGPCRIGRLTVQPLTVMTLRDLEILEGAAVELVHVLRQFVSKDVAIGLHNHIVLHQEEYRPRESSRLVDETLAVLERASQYLFGRATGPSE